MYGRIFQTVDDVRDAVRAFAARYNAEWLIEKNGHRSPDDVRTSLSGAPHNNKRTVCPKNRVRYTRMSHATSFPQFDWLPIII